MNEVTICIRGGLGNQMFQYAAGLALAQRLKVNLCADLAAFAHDPLRSYELEHWRLDAPLPVYARPAPPRRWQRWSGLRRASAYYREPSYCYDGPSWEALTAPVYLDGYFQSPLYFSPIATTIRRAFQLSAPLAASAQDFAAHIRSLPCPVSVHVRRGDYASNPHATAAHGLLGADYYSSALDIMDKLTDGGARYVLFSDDIDAALLLLAGRQVLAVRHAVPVLPHADLVLMQSCHHHIIANSSFSWWGAWLNPRADKRVIAPRLWFSRSTLRTHPVHDLLPTGWIQV